MIEAFYLWKVQNVQMQSDVKFWFDLGNDLIKNDMYTYSNIEANYNELILVVIDSSSNLVLKLEKFSH